ncbi:MAG: hypothetical protein RR064_07085 [Oscillospiraceae bacterium]
MKKLITIFIIVSLISSLMIACTKNEVTDENIHPIDKKPSTNNSTSSSPDPITQDSSEQPVMIADAALYRGELVEIDIDGKWVLAQVEGRNYGKEKLICDISETNFISPQDKVSIGDYLEVYYGIGNSEILSDTSQVEVKPIVLTELSPSKICVINGKITSVDEKSVTVTSDENSEKTFVMHITDETKIYASELAVGDKLSIYHSGMLTRSIPPQGTAIEISIINE